MLLMIGIDGASPELLERLTSTGRMPVVRSLMRHGVYGRLESAPSCDPMSAWSSALTGVGAGKHGVWETRSPGPDRYDVQPAHARTLSAPTLSQMMTDRGLEVGTLFVPMTFPAREAEWTTVAGWPAPSVEAEGFAHPARVATAAARHLKGVELAPRLAGHAASGQFEAGLTVAREGLEAKLRLAEELLGDRAWDMLAVSFVELDRIQRWFWPLIDPHHPDYREDVHAAHGDLIADAYAAIDAAIGRLSEGLRPGDHLLIVSTYGIGLNSRVADCVPTLMAHLDLLAARTSASGLWQRLLQRGGRVADDVLALVRRLLPEQAAGRLLPDEGTPGSWRGAGDPSIEYERSWVIPTPRGHLFLNTEEQFPLGIVSNADVSRLSLKLVQALQTAIDPATGRRPLVWARQREEVCEGPYLNRVPHIVTRWDNRGVVSGLTVTGRNGRVQVARPPGGRYPGGAPAPEGAVIVAGGGVRRGVRIEGARVEDIAATVLHLCGQRIPRYFDGRALTEAYTPAFLDDNPVRHLERELPRVIQDPARIEEATRVVREYLRDTGSEL